MRKVLIAVFFVLIPINIFAFKVTVYDLSEEDSYFNAKDVENNKAITLRWTSSVSNATYYINVDTSSKSPQNQIATGSYNGGDASFTVYASDILSHANNKDDGAKEIYILIEAQESEDAGSSSPKFQENIKPLTVYFDRVPPPTPSISSIVPGENSLNVYLGWGANSTESDKYGFNIYWRKEGSNDEPSVSKNIRTTSHRITGLINNISYEIWAEQLDKAKNVSQKSEVVTGTPREVLDYFEYYKKSGGKEEGGFCFITTAVYGSPVHPLVYVFKAFRDTYLSKSRLGEKIISIYYQHSPPIADFIKNRPILKTLIAVLLVPIAAVLYLLMKPSLVLLIFFMVILIFAFFKKVKSRLILPLLFAFFILPLSANAESERTFGISLNVGSYKPSEIDNEEGLTTKPYKEIFNDKSELMFKLGFDYEIFQKLGTISTGCMLGFWQVLGKGIYGDIQSKSMDTTVFNIIPVELNLTYRFDYYAVNSNIPFVPYVKSGLDYYIFWITDSKGDISKHKDSDGKTFEGYGGKTGYHYSLGLMFLLDWIDRETASDFDMEFGVNNSYIFIEFYKSKIDGFGGKGFDLSNTGLFFGLYLDI